ncbi:MAG: hypothetical protein ACI8VC_001858 [Candidatus Endobugula sp.]|jgi:hypothetical protein
MSSLGLITRSSRITSVAFLARLFEPARFFYVVSAELLSLGLSVSLSSLLGLNIGRFFSPFNTAFQFFNTSSSSACRCITWIHSSNNAHNALTVRVYLITGFLSPFFALRTPYKTLK